MGSNAKHNLLIHVNFKGDYTNTNMDNASIVHTNAKINIIIIQYNVYILLIVRDQSCTYYSYNILSSVVSCLVSQVCWQPEW